MEWFGKDKKFKRGILEDTLRVGLQGDAAYQFIGQAKNKLNVLVNELHLPRKTITLSDGTEISIKMVDEENPRIAIKTAVQPVKEVKKERRKRILPLGNRFPVPTIEIYSQGESSIPLGFLLDGSRFKDEYGEPYHPFEFFHELSERERRNYTSDYKIRFKRGDEEYGLLTEGKELEEWGDDYRIYDISEDTGISHNLSDYAPGPNESGNLWEATWEGPLLVYYYPPDAIGLSTQISQRAQPYWTAIYGPVPNGDISTQRRTLSQITQRTTHIYLGLTSDEFPGDEILRSGVWMQSKSGIYEQGHLYSTAFFGMESFDYSGSDVYLLLGRTTPERQLYCYIWNFINHNGSWMQWGGTGNAYPVYPSIPYYRYKDSLWPPNQYFVSTADRDYLIYEGYDTCDAIDLEIYEYPLNSREPEPVYVFSVKRTARQLDEKGDWVYANQNWIRYGFIWQDVCYMTDWWEFINYSISSHHQIPGFDKGLGYGWIRACQVENKEQQTYDE